jgi:cyclic 2,3-diphosphoglycerate synthetase
VGWSARLADRTGLAEDLDGAQGYDVLLTELKAAAVDVATERALARGAEVVFVDNRPIALDGEADLDSVFGEVLELAMERGGGRDAGQREGGRHERRWDRDRDERP